MAKAKVTGVKAGGAGGNVVDIADQRELARKKWQSSGLTDASAERLRLTYLTAEQARERRYFFNKGKAKPPVMEIPYPDPDGNFPTAAFCRARRLTDPAGFELAALGGAKPQRYAQRAESLNEVYLPPLLPVPWRAVMADPTKDVIITEGELKAAAGCQLGYPTMALGGVEMWRARKKDVALLPALAETAWGGRTAYIAFDSDAATNPDVARARRQLAAALTELGAKTKLTNIPPSSTGTKQGLDDFIVAAKGKAFDAVAKLLADAADWGADLEPFHQLNKEVLYIRHPGMVVELATGKLMDPYKFSGHQYANRHYIVDTETGPRKQKLAPDWIEWEGRNQAEGITYAPGQGRITDGGEWNEWEGWGVQPKPGDTSPWRELLDWVFRGDAGARKWFERWCAYPLQHPGTKMFASAVLWSAHHGTGKTLMGYTLRDIYGKNATEIKDKDLAGNFNEWARNRQFVIGDEVTGSDKREKADLLKGLITQEELRVNVKFMPSYVVRDCVNYYFTSNHPDAFFLDDHDRRYFIWEITGAPLPREFYDRYDDWLKKGNGPAHLFDYLLKLDLKGFNPRAHAPMTEAKQDMIADSKSDLGAWVLRLREDPVGALTAMGAAASKECDLFTPSQLHSCYDPEHATKVTVNGVSRELRRGGYRKRVVRTSTGPTKLFAVRNVEQWEAANPKAWAEHYDKFFGPKARKF